MKQENKEVCCQSSCEAPIDKNYWETRWSKQETGWDIGHAAPAITEYFDQWENKGAAILIPGCGNAYEAEYLLAQGFTNITLLDIAPLAVERLQKKFADNPAIKILCEDFFAHEGKYDVMVEQTFFCAIPPNKRNDYAKKAHQLLNQNGRIVGVLFNREFGNPYPPFGGNTEAYTAIFTPYFEIVKLETCYNSITPRAGTEVFINLSKK